MTSAVPDATPSSTTTRAGGRGLLWTGLALPLAAIALVIAQYSAQLLIVPWYAPLLTTLAAGLLAWSLMRRRSATRVVALALVAVLAGLEWHFLLSSSRLPAYDGPVQVGQTMPAFSVKTAHGQTFSDRDLHKELRSVLVFFRGRW